MQTKLLAILVIFATILVSGSWIYSTYFGASLLYTSTRNNASTNCIHYDETSTSTTVVSLLIDFGNRSRLWFNNTIASNSYSFYDVTNNDVQGNMKSEWYGFPLCAHFIQQILGHGCNTTTNSCSGYWALWTWNDLQGCWKYSSVGADLVPVSGTRMAAWYFTTGDPNIFPNHCS